MTAAEEINTNENGHQKEEKKKKKMATLVFLPLPGMGHLFSMVEFAKKLLLTSGENPNPIQITILSIQPTTPCPKIASYIASVVKEYSNYSDDDGGITFYHLPPLPPALLDVVDRNDPGEFLATLAEFHKPHVKTILEDLRSVSALVVDMFCVDIVDVANDIPCFLFFTSGVTMLGLMLYYPLFHGLLPVGKSMKEWQEEALTVTLPGFSGQVPVINLPEGFHRRNANEKHWFLHFCKRYPDMKGFIVNSYQDLQPYGFEAMAEGKYLLHRSTPPVYSVGPLLSAESTEGEDGRHECLRWLDGQPSRSVVYLCFGSMGSFSEKQVVEMATALEQSELRFLWVLRRPAPEHLKGLSRVSIDADLDAVLPKGFLERTADGGIVWPKFAPQTGILAHEAVGGFVTHCGWNSTLESLWFGVPMLAWPLYAEQHMNAYEMVTEMDAAPELKIDRANGNWVSSEELERGLRCLMDNHDERSMKVRSRVVELMAEARRALSKGGSSFASMAKLREDLVSISEDRK